MVFKLFVIVALIFALKHKHGANPSEITSGYHNGASSHANVKSGRGSLDGLVTVETYTTTVSENSALDVITTSSATETDSKTTENVTKDTNNCILFKFMIGTVGIGFLVAFGLVGNVLSFIVLFKQRSTSASILILLALSTVDSIFIVLMFILKSVPAFVAFSGLLTGFNYYYPYFFVYGWPLVPSVSTMTAFITLLMAIHRFVAVCKPFNLKTIASVRQTQFQIACVFAFAIIFNIPFFFVYSLHTVSSPETNATYSVWRTRDLQNNFYFYLIYVVVGHYVVILICPFITLLIITIKLIRELRRAARARSDMSTKAGSHNKQADEITPALIGILIVYFICQIPVFIRRLTAMVFPKDDRDCSFDVYAEDINAFLMVFSSSVNFVIYNTVSKSFRETLAKTFKFQKFTFASQQKDRTSKTDPSTSKTEIENARKEEA